MNLKFNPDKLLFSAAFLFESDSEMGVALSNDDPALKKYEILVEIKDSNEWFKIHKDENNNTSLSRGTKDLSAWEVQNLNELERYKDKLGIVTVNKEQKVRKEYHNYDIFCDEILLGLNKQR